MCQSPGNSARAKQGRGPGGESWLVFSSWRRCWLSERWATNEMFRGCVKIDIETMTPYLTSLNIKGFFTAIKTTMVESSRGILDALLCYWRVCLLTSYHSLTLNCWNVLQWQLSDLSLTAPGPCDSSPCLNGAECRSYGSRWYQYYCLCRPRGKYFGRHCEHGKFVGVFFKKKAIVLESSVIIRCTLHSTDLLTIDEAGRFGKQDLIRS